MRLIDYLILTALGIAFAYLVATFAIGITQTAFERAAANFEQPR